MSKAEERALEAYPEDVQLFVESQEEPGKWLPVDENYQLRYGYKRGYEQAEEDLALTWEDIRKIVILFSDVSSECFDTKSANEMCEETLTRFKQYKEEKQ